MSDSDEDYVPGTAQDGDDGDSGDGDGAEQGEDGSMYIDRETLLRLLYRQLMQQEAAQAGQDAGDIEIEIDDDDDDDEDYTSDGEEDQEEAEEEDEDAETARFARRNQSRPAIVAAMRSGFEREQLAAVKEHSFAQDTYSRCQPHGVGAHDKGKENLASMLWQRSLGRTNGMGLRASARHGAAGVGITGAWNSHEKAHVLSRTLPNKRSRVVMRQRDRIYSGQYTPSGSMFVAACQSNDLQLFDTSTWKRMKSIQTRGVRWTVTSTDVSPDEEFVAYSSINDTVHLCNTRGEYEHHEALDMEARDMYMERFGIWCIKFSPRGTELIAGTTKHSVLVYDLERKEVVHSMRCAEDDINSVAYASEHLIVTGSDDTLIKVIDTRLMSSESRSRRTRPVGVLPGHSEGLTHVCGKGDGRYILSNSKDQTAKLWDLRCMLSSSAFGALPNVQPRYHWDYRWMSYPGWGRAHRHPNDTSLLTYRSHEVCHTLIRCYFSPMSTGQRYVYSGSADGTVYIYDALTAEPVQTLPCNRAEVIRDVSWHPHKPEIAVPTWGGELALWTHSPELADSAGPGAAAGASGAGAGAGAGAGTA